MIPEPFQVATGNWRRHRMSVKDTAAHHTYFRAAERTGQAPGRSNSEATNLLDLAAATSQYFCGRATFGYEAIDAGWLYSRIQPHPAFARITPT